MCAHGIKPPLNTLFLLMYAQIATLDLMIITESRLWFYLCYCFSCLYAVCFGRKSLVWIYVVCVCVCVCVCVIWLSPYFVCVWLRYVFDMAVCVSVLAVCVYYRCRTLCGFDVLVYVLVYMLGRLCLFYPQVSFLAFVFLLALSIF